jgi:hypothetical protein
MSHAARLRPLTLGLLFLLACEPEAPESPPAPPVLKVTFTGAETVHCTSTPVVLTFSIEGGTPDSVELRGADGKVIAPLAAPYQYLFDCGAREESTYTFTALARAGTQAFSSPPKRVVVDRSKPTVQGPFTGVIEEIARDAPIRLTFSEPLRTDRVSAASVNLEGIPSQSLSWSEDGRTLTVTPSQPIGAPARLTLTLREEDFQDLAGNGLSVPSSPMRWVWDVPAFLTTWALPKTGNGVLPGDRPAFAVDHAGRRIVAWYEYTSASGAADVYVHRSGESGSTLLGAPLSGLPGQGSSVEELTLAVDASDRPVVAWIEQGAAVGDDRRIFVRRWEGTRWEALGEVPPPAPGQYPDHLTLATGNTDQPVVAWTQMTNGELNVYVYRWSGSGWEALGGALEARGGTTHTRHPALAVDGEGRPVIAFSEWTTDTGPANVFVMRWNGTGWAQVGQLPRPSGASPSASSARISLVLDAAGQPVVAYEFNLSGSSFDYGIYTSRYSGSAWSAPAPVSTAAASRPSVYLDAEGLLWVAYQDETAASVSDRSVVFNRFGGSGPSPYATLSKAGSPVLAGSGGAPLMLVADIARQVPRVVTRQ